MKIKTQFFITMAVFGVTLAVIGTSLVASVQRISHLDREEDTAVDIGRGASELAYLTDDFLLYREDQQRRRWESQWDSVSRDVSRLTPISTEERAIVTQIERSLARAKAVFADVAEAPIATRRTGGGPESDAFQIAWSRLAVQNQSTAFDALRLSRELRTQKADVTRNNVLLISVMLPLFAIYFVTNYVIVYHRTLGSIEQLRAGTRIVGSGDLDYTIPATRNDEIGALSRAFNRMTKDLKGVTASKVELEHEIEEREKAETALTESLQRIEAMGLARERELETTRLLLGAAQALAERTNLNQLLEVLADIVLASTDHKRVSVLMWDHKRRELKAFVVRGEAGDYPPEETVAWTELSHDAQEVIEAMRSKVIDYDALPEDRRGKVVTFGARLGLVVPLVFHQRLLGLVRVDDPGERREFVERDIALIQGIAAQAAVAIENCRLFEEEHRVADALRAIFQQPVPSVPGMELDVVGQYASETANVGGDFYDAFELDDHTVVIVGDVAGKGLGAVGLTERVRSAVRAVARAGSALTPGYLLGRVNESLVRDLKDNEFITAALITINPRTGAYRIASAGHPLPVICGASCRQPDVHPGVPLGVMEAEYSDVAGVLGPEETLVMYTDGVTEARRDSDFYGEERLMTFLAGQTLSPTQTSRALYADVQEFSRGNLADDLLILALRLDSGANTASPSDST